jgi:virginiamycin B lyase
MAEVLRAPAGRLRPKAVVEYPLPAAGQTHEIAAIPGTDLLAVSQQTDSILVKVELDPATGAPVRSAGHLVGTPTSGLHGLFASTSRPGLLWATLQFESKVLLLDPVAGDLHSPPRVLASYELPVPARGPHCLVEDGGEVWAAAKDGNHIVRITPSEPPRFTVYPALPRPIFVARHANTGLVFAAELQSSKILRIDPATGKTGQIDIPPHVGSTPVGMIAGPDGNVWFVLLGGMDGGTGMFGRITGAETVEWYRLAAGALKLAGLVHLAWESGKESPSLLLLASAPAAAARGALNAVIRVTFDAGFTAIASEAAAVMPTPGCVTHRVLATPRGWYVTELGACQLAHVSSGWAGAGLQAVDESADFFSDFGMGVAAETVAYAPPFGS